MVKYNPKQEMFVLKVIQELKYGTIEEIAERMTHPPFDEYETLHPETEKLLRLIIKRWEKGKAIISDVFGQERRYFVRDAPWLARLQMVHFVSVSSEEAKNLRDELVTRCREISARERRTPDIGDYVMVEATFETVDPILGGDKGEIEKLLTFPRKFDGTLYIRPNWLCGYFRDNGRLLNVTKLGHYINPTQGIFIKEPKIFKTKEIKVKVGHNIYEAIEPKAQFKTILHLPLKGYEGFDSVEKWLEGIRKICDAPLRGLGANSKVFGGRIKLLEITKK